MNSRRRVTVVHDDPEFLSLMGDVLAEDYVPTLIDESDDALDAVRSSAPALVIVEMPMVDDLAAGRSIAAAVRSDPAFRNVPILLCSPVIELEATATEFPAPTNGVIRTPFALNELLEAIDRLLTAPQPA